MKYLRLYKILRAYCLSIIFLLGMATIQSCDNDGDLPAEDEQADMQDTENTDPPEEEANDQNPSDFEDPAAEQGDITLYTVISGGDEIVKKMDFEVSGTELELQKDIEKHQEVWNLVKKLVPKNYRAKMSEFMIFAGEKTGAAGYVYNTKDDLSKWQMGIAIDFAFVGETFDAEGELSYIIIHEFGHILTLDNLQVDSSISESDCTNYFVGEGCAKQQAYINKSYQEFWADIADEFKMVNSQSEGQAFYEKYKDRFVTPYSSVNPVEDIAEVFTNFVLIENQPTGTAIKDQKILRMYDEAALIGIRNFIRDRQDASKRRLFLKSTSSKRISELTSCVTYRRR